MVEIKKFLKDIGDEALLELYRTIFRARKNEEYDEAEAIAALTSYIENTGVKMVLNELKLDELQSVAEGFKVAVEDTYKSKKGFYVKRIYEKITGDTKEVDEIIKEKKKEEKETTKEGDKKEKDGKSKKAEEKEKKGKAAKGKGKEEEKKEDKNDKDEKDGKKTVPKGKMVTRERALEVKAATKDVPALAEQLALLNATSLDLFLDVLSIDKGTLSHKATATAVAQAIHATGLSSTLSETNVTFLKGVSTKLKLDVEGESSKSIIIGLIVDRERPPKKAKAAQEKKVLDVSKNKPALSATITEEDIHQHYYLEELQEFCRDNGISVSGKKKELGKRIIAHFNGKSGDAGKKADKKAETEKESEEKTEKKAEKKTGKGKKTEKDEKKVEKDEKKVEKEEKKADKEEKKADKEEKKVGKEEKKVGKDGKKAETDEKKVEKDEKKAEKDEKKVEKDEKAGKKTGKGKKSEKKGDEKDEKKTEKDEKKTEKDEKKTEKDEKKTEEDKPEEKKAGKSSKRGAGSSPAKTRPAKKTKKGE